MLKSADHKLQLKEWCSSARWNLDVVKSGGRTEWKGAGRRRKGIVFILSISKNRYSRFDKLFSAYFTSKKFIAKTDLYQAEPFLFYPTII